VVFNASLAGSKTTTANLRRKKSSPDFLQQFDRWTQDFAAFVLKKGKVKPGKHRAFGLKRGNPFFKEIPLAVRDVRMRLGYPPVNSSPEKQQKLGLNKDVTLFPKGSESKRYYKLVKKLGIENKKSDEAIRSDALCGSGTTGGAFEIQAFCFISIEEVLRSNLS